MTANARLRAAVSERSREILKRCYRSEPDDDVVERALNMLAGADGHLHPNGQIKTGAGGRPTTRRTT